MANEKPNRWDPPDLRELARRTSIDPAEMPTQADGAVAVLPPETVEVELVPTTTEAARPAVVPLGPPVRRRQLPVLTSERPPRRWTAGRWFGNVVVAAVGLGLLGGISFALGAMWIVEPAQTERWLIRAAEWIPRVEVPFLQPSPEPEKPPARDLDARVPSAAALPADLAAAIDTGQDQGLGEVPEAQEEPEAPEAPEAAGAAELPDPVERPVRRPRRRVRRPSPVAVPPPVPMVKPYAERPRPQPTPPPVPGSPPGPAVDESSGLLLER